MSSRLPYANLVDKDHQLLQWVFIRSPYPVLITIAMYLFFVFRVGPVQMQGKPPYKLLNILRVYNIIQVAYNFLIFLQVVSYPSAVKVILTMSCSPLDKPEYKEVKGVYLTFFVHYMTLKVIDLLDTVFLVLKKKKTHISFLHVYHHISMVFLVWFSLHSILSFHAIVLALLNTFVHGVMYSYYFLATFPSLSGYLWWKSHLTKLQLLQFAICLLYVGGLIVYGCPISHVFALLWVFNLTVITCLFINFYIKSYFNLHNKKIY